MDQNELPVEPIEVWAIVEIFGHHKLAGKITRPGIFVDVRIDVPASKSHPAFTVEYGRAALFSVLPTTEEIATAAALALDVDPVNVYAPELITKAQYEEVKAEVERLRSQRALPARRAQIEDSDEDDSDEGINDF